jgi:hypothetical protein
MKGAIAKRAILEDRTPASGQWMRRPLGAKEPRRFLSREDSAGHLRESVRCRTLGNVRVDRSARYRTDAMAPTRQIPVMSALRIRIGSWRSRWSPAAGATNIRAGAALHTMPAVSPVLKQTARALLWLSVTSIGVATALSLSMPPRSIPAGLAQIPEASAALDDDLPGDLPTTSPPARPATGATITRGHRVRCPECAVVESITQVDRHEVGQVQEKAPSHRADRIAAEVPDNGMGTTGGIGKWYAMTVRFGDGSTRVFYEPTPRNWRPGNRILVIAGTSLPNR